MNGTHKGNKRKLLAEKDLEEIKNHDIFKDTLKPIVDVPRKTIPMIPVNSRIQLTTKGKRWFCDNNAPEHVLATIVAHRQNEKDCYKLDFDNKEYGRLSSYADKTDVELWIE